MEYSSGIVKINIENSREMRNAEDLKNIQSVDEFLKLSREESIEVFEYLEIELQEKIIFELENSNQDERIEELLHKLPSPKSLYLLQHVSEEELVFRFSPNFVAHIFESTKYPSESVGKIASPIYTAVQSHWTVKRVKEYIKSRDERYTQNLSTIFVTDKLSWDFEGTMTTRDLLVADENEIVANVMNYDTKCISAYEDQENTIMIMQYYKLLDIPVVDKKKLISVVNIKKVMEVQIEEISEDLYIASGQVPLKSQYSKTNAFKLFLKRIIWMIILLFVNLGSSSIISIFDETLKENIALSYFIPLLIDTGGNIGSQSTTLIIRALTTNDIDMNCRGLFTILLKETWVQLMIGLTLSILSFVLGYIWSGVAVGLVVAITMFILIYVANTIGVILPFLLTAVKLDPAVASGPLITTLIDTCGIAIYFGIAQLIIYGFQLK